MPSRISYLPSQLDPLAGTSTRAARLSPTRLVLDDFAVLFHCLRYLPGIITPFWTRDKTDELYSGPSNARDIFLQFLLFFMQVAFLISAIPAILCLPFSILISFAVLACLAMILVASPMQGPRIAYSKMDDATMAMAEQHKDERWVFINGCITSHNGLQNNIDRISQLFGRACIGIHNKSYGLIADLLECLIQRSLGFQSMDVRVAYAYVKAVLVDPTVSKVVLIGHSQGGLVISLVLDHIFQELPASIMSKLEIYTFGSAASHFSNPLVALPSGSATSSSPFSTVKLLFNTPTEPEHVIQYIEHYANSDDLVPRWGVLHSVSHILQNRYAGSVFVRIGASGHLFNQHYLGPMFPKFKQKEAGVSTQRPGECFLDTVIRIDEELCMKRENFAFAEMGIMRRESGVEFGDGNVFKGGAIKGTKLTGDVVAFKRTDTGRLMAEEAKGKTVRELSRFWRYRGGKSPEPMYPQ